MIGSTFEADSQPRGALSELLDSSIRFRSITSFVRRRPRMPFPLSQTHPPFYTRTIEYSGTQTKGLTRRGTSTSGNLRSKGQKVSHGNKPATTAINFGIFAYT